jgi:hypothetical protein
MGAWAASTAYALDDVVTTSGKTYICILAYTSGSSFAVGSNWSLMAEKGTDGSNGASGIPSGGSVGQVVTNTGAGAGGWADAAGGGGVLQVKNTIYTGSTSYNSTSWGQMTSNLDVTITPSGADKSFYIEALLWCSPQNHDTGYVFNIADSQVGTTTGIFPNHANNGSAIGGYAGLHSWASISGPDQYQLSPIPISGFYTPTSNNASARTFNIIGRKTTSTGSVALHINIQASNATGDRSILACSNITVWEIENGIYS